MIPVLYEPLARDFENNGIGFLTDAVECIVTEERNGSYELTLTYPTTGHLYDRITEGSVIKAQPNAISAPQLFRIYRSEKDMNGIAEFFAQHISYDLVGIPIFPFSMQSVTPEFAMQKAFDDAAFSCKFTASSDIEHVNDISIGEPCSLRSFLGGQQGSVLDTWNGEFEFDNFTVKLHKARGADRGIVIAYGKNLQKLNVDISVDRAYTHIFGFAKKQEDVNGEQVEDVVLASRSVMLALLPIAGHLNALIFDFTQYFAENEPITPESVYNKALAYAQANNLANPRMSVEVSFVQLWQTEEYKEIEPLERIGLCDIVTIRHAGLGIDVKVKAIKTVYDVLRDRYESMTLGDPKGSIKDMLNPNANNNIYDVFANKMKETLNILKKIKGDIDEN